MSGELMTQVEQVAVVDGVKLDSVSNILVGEHVAKLPFARARGRLYVLVEPIGDRTGWGGLSREIAQAVHDEYYESSGSVTAGLRRALERANELLCDMNAAESRRSPRLAGISAVVLKGNDVYVAQTGPALVYVLHKDSTVRFPEDSPWLEMSPRQAMEEGYAPPLGLRAELSPDLFHCQVEVGDSLALAESSVASCADEEEAGLLFGREDDAAAAARLQSLFCDRDVSLVLVRVCAADDGQVESRRIHRLTPLSDAAEPRMARMAPAPAGEGEGSSVRGVLRRVGAMVAYGSMRAAGAGRVVWRRMLPGSDRSRAARLRRRTSSRLSLAPQTKRPWSDDRLVLVGMLAGLAFVAVLAYGVIRWQGERLAASRYQRTVQTVQEKLVAAADAGDKDSARQMLSEADVLLTRALAMGQANRETTELSLQLGEQLDKLDGVERLYWLPVLRSYEDAGGNQTRVLTQGIDVYVLDTGLGRVYKYLFNAMTDGLQEFGEDVPEVLLRTGDLRDDLTVGRLVDMAWVPAGPNRPWGALLVLEESGALLEYEPSSGIKVLPAHQRSELQEPRRVAGIDGHLLVLDARANQVLVYGPGAGGYETQPQPYANVDLLLSGVVDMAVDGDVYLLYADGLVAKLRGGEQMAFDLTGLDTRFRNPTALCVTPGYVYVADAGNERIVQLTKDGQYVRQFKAQRGEPAFEAITGLYVDEVAGKMVVLSGGRLLLANLPQ